MVTFDQKGQIFVIQKSQKTREIVLETWHASPFGKLPADVRDAVLKDAFMMDFAAGQSLGSVDSEPRMHLIHFGLVRVRAIAANGRSVTLRYAGEGSAIGLPTVMSGGKAISSDAVFAAQTVMISPSRIRAVAVSHGELAWLLAQETANLLFEAVELLAENVFGPVSQRVARHLLDLAEPDPDGLLVKVDQQALAEATGTVREVVARSLKKLRDEGIIGKGAGGIRILDAQRLHAVASGSLPL